MDSASPRVTILLATYNPPLEWLALQLRSLDRQDYNNVQLLALDDASPGISLEELEAFFQGNLHRIPYRLGRNDVNMGSTKTFEKLTALARSGYIAFCDQDDIWDTDKISRSMQTLKEYGALLVCGDAQIIDGEGQLTASSVTDIRKRQVFASGEHLAAHIFFGNYVTGCTVLMDSETAKAAIPFPASMVHDHWLGVFAANRGRIQVCEGTVMQYRIHGRNQTGILSGIGNKRDYYNKRIEPFYMQAMEISQRLKPEPFISQALQWAAARRDYFNGSLRAAGNILKHRRYNPKVSLFELALRFMPTPLFRLILKKIQDGTL